MRLDQNPFFRKIIVPWYDCDAACGILLVGMGTVILFGLIGIGVTHQNQEYTRHMWIPLLLIFLSAAVIVSTLIRLLKRRLHRYDR